MAGTLKGLISHVTGLVLLSAVPALSFDIPFTPPEQLASPSAAFIKRCTTFGKLIQAEAVKKALAAECLAKWNPAFRSHEYEDKLYGYIWFSVDANGLLKVTGLFSNGKKWQGEEGLGAALILESSATKELIAVNLSAAVAGAEFSKGSKEIWRKGELQLTKEQLSLIDQVQVSWHRFVTPDQFDAFMTGQYTDWSFLVPVYTF